MENQGSSNNKENADPASNVPGVEAPKIYTIESEFESKSFRTFTFANLHENFSPENHQGTSAAARLATWRLPTLSWILHSAREAIEESLKLATGRQETFQETRSQHHPPGGQEVQREVCANSADVG